MDFDLTEDQATIFAAVKDLASRFDDQYWMEKDAAHEFPTEFYDMLAGGGWLGITTPEEYGGQGFGITEASLLLEAVSASGGGMNSCRRIRKARSSNRLRRSQPVTSSLHLLALQEPQAGAMLSSV